MKKYIFLFALGFITSAFGAAYYVAPWGNDTNPGTLSRPWRTINKSATTMIANDSVLIRAGTYKESVNPSRSGTSGALITYTNYNNEEVIVEGGETVTGWVVDSGNRYRATVNFTPSPRFTSIRDPRNNYGGLVLQNGAKMRYAMVPGRSAVDAPGEYYMNDSASPPYTIYVYVRDLGSGYDPNNYQMILGRYRKGFDLDGGEDYLVVDGLTFRDYNDNAIHSIGSNYCQFKNLKLYSNFITGIYLTDYSRYCVIERCLFWDNGHGGIELARSYSTTIKKSKFTAIDLGDSLGGNGAHMWLGPLTYYSDSCLIENNIAFKSGSDYIRMGAFLVIRGSYNVVRHNSAINYGGCGVAPFAGRNNTVINNAIDCTRGHCCIHVANDSGHFIQNNDFHATSPIGKYIWNNIAYNSLSEWETASGQRNNIDSLPGFVQPDSNLHLIPNSACIDRGTAVNASSEDYDGVTRPQGLGYDMGAYEYRAGAVTEQFSAARHSYIRLRPNPVSHGVWINRSSSESCAKLRIFDLTGRLVKTLDFKENQIEIFWDGRDNAGARLPAGNYYLVFTSSSFPKAERKIILLR